MTDFDPDLEIYLKETSSECLVFLKNLITQFDLPIARTQREHFDLVSSNPVYSFVNDIDDHAIELAATILTPKANCNPANIRQDATKLCITSSILITSHHQNIKPENLITTLNNVPMHPEIKLDTLCTSRKIPNTIAVGNNTLTENDIKTLDGNSWLNDSVRKIKHL